jgi:SNF2 family DNA or RNA helicase
MPEVIIYDEAHKLKDHRAKRSIQARILSDLPSVKHRYILTGTPVLKDPRDLFAQFRVMDCGATFGQNFWRFQGYFCVDKNSWMRGRQGYYPKWVVREGANDEINRLIYKSAMRVKKEECLDLPPLVRQTIHCEMTDIQKKLYEEMKKNFITYIDQKAVVAELAITKALRLLQISSGYVKFDDGDAKSLENTPKQIALKELLEEITPNHKVIVWAVFKKFHLRPSLQTLTVSTQTLIVVSLLAILAPVGSVSILLALHILSFTLAIFLWSKISRLKAGITEAGVKSMNESHGLTLSPREPSIS